MRKVKWCNVWNWSQEEGGVTRVHLTKSEGLSGTTLCGRAFPSRKGHPTAAHYCKACLRGTGLTLIQLRALDSVPSADE
jgi:phage terminase large subunit GpA-like protein